MLVGCLLNRTAVAEAALGIAGERSLDIVIVCSAAYGGSTFVLEDALGAGAIVDAALPHDRSIVLGDAARFARDAFRAVSDDTVEAVASAYHGRELVDTGLGEDVAYCGRLDVSSVAPLLKRGEDGVLALRPHKLRPS